MKKIYWIFPLALVIIAIVIVGCIKNSPNNIANQNLCQQVISLTDIKNTCSPSFEINEDTNDSYYFVPNETNTIANDWGKVIQPTETSSVTLRDGTEWLCEKIISNNKRTYESDSNSLSLKIEKFGSPSFADEAWIFYTSGDYKEGKGFGEKSFIISFPGGEVYDPIYNQTANTLKSTTLQFLKNNKIITITEASPKENNLICDLNQIQKLATLVDTKIE